MEFFDKTFLGYSYGEWIGWIIVIILCIFFYVWLFSFIPAVVIIEGHAVTKFWLAVSIAIIHILFAVIGPNVHFSSGGEPEPEEKIDPYDEDHRSYD